MKPKEKQILTAISKTLPHLRNCDIECWLNFGEELIFMVNLEPQLKDRQARGYIIKR